ncbi:MAG TPA: UDP-N-acetylglucosamine 2-epimerase (non-hydrolyzing), partial [Anaerolineales bacterium]
FAPTEEAKQALVAEGVAGSNIFVTGNTVIDALLYIRDRVRSRPPELPAGLKSAIDGRQLVLVTGHRRESFGEGFENICKAILAVAEQFPQVLFVYPVHLNPNVREPVNRILGGHDRIILIEPLPYEPFVWLMDRATLVLTDSGGVQEEAPSLGKPVLVMREITERPEGVAAGNARLVGVNRDRIVDSLAQLLTHPAEREAMSKVRNPYGDGLASIRIADILARLS